MLATLVLACLFADVDLHRLRGLLSSPQQTPETLNNIRNGMKEKNELSLVSVFLLNPAIAASPFIGERLSSQLHQHIGNAYPASSRQASWGRRLLPIAADASDYEISVVSDTDEIKDVCKFFVDAFWRGSTTDQITDMVLTPEESEWVAEEHYSNFQERFGYRPRRKLKASLFVARERSSGEIVGIVGVESSLFDPTEKKIVEKSEAMLVDEIAKLSPIQARSMGIRKMDVSTIVEKLMPEYKVAAYLSNLAVAPSTRRSGLGRILCAKCEEFATKQGLPGILLNVEQANEVGHQLYSALGYQDVHVNNAHRVARPHPGSSRDNFIRHVKAPLVLMSKTVEAN
jgi:ribosomal protein S18 acetylase RimI-like enzyme